MTDFVLVVILIPSLFWWIEWRERRLSATHVAALAAERQLRLDELAAASSRHAGDIERLHEVYLKAIERIGNIANYGSPERAEHHVEEREPGPEERLGRLIDQDTLNRAKADISKLYREMGVHPTDEEIDREARSLLLGGPWTAPESLKEFFRPGPQVEVPRD